MLPSLSTLAVVCLGVAPLVDAAAASCGLSNKCPKESPCCSQYGECGVGAYCLGGCDPRSSFSLDSCMPAPVCASKTMSMTNTDNIIDVSDYLGDPTSADWVAQGTPLPYNGNTILTMPKDSVGTVLASTTYIWYGNVKAKMKTSKDAGVVTAFILLSDVKDEIDFEWVGTDLTTAQTNYYFQGIPDYTNTANITSLSDTNANFHEYEVRWTPDTIEWLVDGEVDHSRTVKKADTWNATANQWDYPQTPARLQLSIWPGGAASNAEGTINWAGGAINWDSEAIQKDGYYYATVGEVSIECYQTDSPPGTNSGTSYVYNDISGLNNTVEDTDKDTTLASLLGSGLDPDKDYPKSSASQSGDAAVIPGLSGGGPGTNGQAAGGSDGGDSGSGSGSSGNGATGTDSSSAACTSGFSQVCGESDSPQSGGVKADRVLGASAFAALIAIGGMLWL
ncbi:glycoside hydrolase family 16 protein [Xylariomycetidae sp. FL0641]|nr:glycoside hydrolase family 16 protein [Xylariomycetidae sp. FL0641]